MWLEIPFTGREDLEKKMNSSRCRDLKGEVGSFLGKLADFLKDKFHVLPSAYPGDWLDLAMEAFCHFYTYSLKIFDPSKAPFKGFLTTCVINFVDSKYSGHKNQQEHISLNAKLINNPPQRLKYESTCEDNIEYEKKFAQFKAEDPEAAEVLLLFDKGYKKSQIPDILGISRATLKRRQKRGVDFLMRDISQRDLGVYRNVINRRQTHGKRKS
jgi:DNA-directed RNA polymerase specialized sigma24 family protein